VFQLEVVNVYAEARSDYAARMLRTIPESDGTLAASSDPVLPAEPEGKPIYKKWWFYAGAAATMLLVGAAVGGGGDDAGPPAATGTVVVGVRVQ
jgi:hypothetical protein